MLAAASVRFFFSKVVGIIAVASWRRRFGLSRYNTAVGMIG